MSLNHPKLVELLQRAYSAEKAAALAYVGHANSVRDLDEQIAIKQIENDEWSHRENVLAIMRQYDIPILRWYEFKFSVIGRVIGFSCHVIGWFMPFFFAGRLESGNVCEYFIMMQWFHSLGICEHDKVLYEMGIKEKEHELYFLEQIKDSRMLPFFEFLFTWGRRGSRNDVSLEEKLPVEKSDQYCKRP